MKDFDLMCYRVLEGGELSLLESVAINLPRTFYLVHVGNRRIPNLGFFPNSSIVTSGMPDDVNVLIEEEGEDNLGIAFVLGCYESYRPYCVNYSEEELLLKNNWPRTFLDYYELSSCLPLRFRIEDYLFMLTEKR